MYWADIGRWFAADPQKQFSSPYAGMGNVPTMGRDPNGEVFIPILLAALQWVGYTNMAFSVGQAFTRGGWQAAGQALASNAFSFGIGMVAGVAFGGILPDAGNTLGTFKGAALGGLSGALSGGVAGGITSEIGGGNFWEGFGNAALTGGITGGLAGGYWGYKNALNAGKNVWWGTDVNDGRTQFSFFTSKIEQNARIIKTGNYYENERQTTETILNKADKENGIAVAYQLEKGGSAVMNKVGYTPKTGENALPSVNWGRLKQQKPKVHINGRWMRVKGVSVAIPDGDKFNLGAHGEIDMLKSDFGVIRKNWAPMLIRMQIRHLSVDFVRPIHWQSLKYEFGKIK